MPPPPHHSLFFSLPLITFKIVAAIHCEALRLWLNDARPDAATANTINTGLAAGKPHDYTGAALPASGQEPGREKALWSSEGRI